MRRRRACRSCGAPLEQAAVGRPRQYCGDACRQRAGRRRSRGPRSTRTDDWSTPQALWDELDAKYAFGLDVAADAGSARCDYLGPDHPDPARRDALRFDSWAPLAAGRTIWMNCPYKVPGIERWLRRALTTSRDGVTVVALLPASVGAKWWVAGVKPFGEIDYIEGRLSFGDVPGVAQFWSALVVYPAACPAVRPGASTGRP